MVNHTPKHHSRMLIVLAFALTITTAAAFFVSARAAYRAALVRADGVIHATAMWLPAYAHIAANTTGAEALGPRQRSRHGLSWSD